MSGVLSRCDVVVTPVAIARCASLSCLHIISTHVGRIRCAMNCTPNVGHNLTSEGAVYETFI
ncbi:hypothetical protein CIJ93_19830 [Escherichia coli]|nr:hypothetical protein CIJ93_19830 [Escherichia coli]OZX88810.1 hypothetical protein CIJ95_10955 [Escherichia coli]OZY11652.1 hypothetical protein CIJ87_24175 [Escherichia coli]